MQPQEFLRKEMEKLISRFTFLQIRYEYTSFDGTHCIEVLPQHYYHHNEEYIAAENSIRELFTKNYPKETLFFVTEDSLYQVENPSFILKGISFGLNMLENKYNVTTIFEELKEYEVTPFHQDVTVLSSFLLEIKTNAKNCKQVEQENEFWGEGSFVWAA